MHHASEHKNAGKLTRWLLALSLALTMAWPTTALAAEGDDASGDVQVTQPSTPENPGDSQTTEPSDPAAGPEEGTPNGEGTQGGTPGIPDGEGTAGSWATLEPPSEPAQDEAVQKPQKPQKKKLTITGLQTSFTRTSKQSVSDAIKVKPAGKHKVVLQQYNGSTKKWVTKATFTTKANGTVTLKYPTPWRKHNSTSWRVVISATSKYERCVSKTVRIATKNRSSVKLSAKSAIIMDASTGQIYFTKNENVKRQNASTTKIMTALLTLERNKLTDYVTITADAANTLCSYMGTKVIGDQISVKNLLYMALLPSDNGAAKALGVHTAGTEKKFITMMNRRAKELGCTKTSFKNPHGLVDPGHGTTARDLALIAREALKNPTFKKIVGTKSYSFRTRGGLQYKLTSTDELLGKVKGVYGVKTGYTTAAQYCFVGAFKHKGHSYITVVLGSPNSSSRWNDTKALIRYVKKWF